MALNAAQQDFYRNNGYLVVEDVVPPAELERLREVVSGFQEQSREITV